MFGQMYQAASINLSLRRGVNLLDDSTQAEMRAWIYSQQTEAGGFPDRGGESDLYYTLFGFFLSEALEMEMALPMLKEYVRRTAQPQNHTGIDLFCLAILHASLFPDDPATGSFIREIRKFHREKKFIQNGYSGFLVILSLLYLHDYAGAWQILKSFGNGWNETDKPCPVVSAEQVLASLKSGKKEGMAEPIMSFYRVNGGFNALSNAPSADLLSTAVALFALRFTGYDLRLIRPDCFIFIDGLYYEGGFKANALDAQIDVEYTFYGLLALGALNYGVKPVDF
ncbi:MAG: prenyltransferase/squalene oxidase repeat-containing protein [Bacteroidota bacterium]